MAPTRLNLVSPILEAGHTADVIFADVTILESILEQVAELGNHFPIVIVGKNTVQKAEASRNTGFNVFALEELETLGKEAEDKVDVDRSRCRLSVLDCIATDHGSLEPERPFTTSFYDEVDGVTDGSLYL